MKKNLTDAVRLHNIENGTLGTRNNLEMKKNSRHYSLAIMCFKWVTINFKFMIRCKKI
jgi:hypothetical protein